MRIISESTLKQILQTISPFLVAVAIVVPLCLAVRLAMADEAPPVQVQDSADAITINQKRIAELRPLVEEFELLKADNAKLQGRMEAFGWSYDWATNKPVKLEASLTERQ